MIPVVHLEFGVRSCECSDECMDLQIWDQMEDFHLKTTFKIAPSRVALSVIAYACPLHGGFRVDHAR